ncbi:MAG TPA: GNAT family N-acetyltransferase [Methanoregulaceae archaeon]|nr:GNAT family N-acetyltransferase [Methanoregulaceae archaeon]HQJ88937.1 GNAT family N-acetyltransferase [Methanoregulaceae archaeon]
MAEVVIRPARPDDCDRLLELVRELAAYERAPDAVIVSPVAFEKAGFGPGAVWEALVAEDGGEVVGFALWFVRFSTWTGCRLYLEDIIVTGSRRGEGIGRRLFEAVIAVARDRGYAGLSWQMLGWNESARAFYDRFGARYDDEWVNCHLDL